MKFTYGWLTDYLETQASPQDIANALDKIGLEVEELIDHAQSLRPFKVARVLDVQKHPQADRLNLCKVETDQGLKQIVCGANNVKTGMLAIVALPGALIPATKTILAKGTIRGIDSEGMLVSGRELGLSDEHDGIIALSNQWPIGTAATEALGLETLFHIKITPNRPDALGVYGIARDLAAYGLGNLKPLAIEPVLGHYDSPITISLDFDEPKPCPFFVGRAVSNVTNRQSPDWLQNRLQAIGLRPISALVDITNYISYSFARPLHVFDADKLSGPLCVRAASLGETLLALDDKTYHLTSDMMVIADTNGPQAIAGIMGAASSACDEHSNNIFLESAYFNPHSIAATGRRLGILSDARYRFERGVDPAFTLLGAEIATKMILDICGGTASHCVQVGQIPQANVQYSLGKQRVKSLAGLDVTAEKQKNILQDLGFDIIEEPESFLCKPPSWRPDIHGEADLVEEICRIVGIETIPSVPIPPLHALAKPIVTKSQRRTLLVRRLLAARGFHETISWAFLSHKNALLFGGGQKELQLANPISNELTDMRPSLLPNLIEAAGRNLARGFHDFSLSEIGSVYQGDAPEDESLRAAGIRHGAAERRNWRVKNRNYDCFDVKADLFACLEGAAVNLNALSLVAGAPDWFHPGRCATVQMGPKNIVGFFGEIHPLICQEMDIKIPLYGFELILSALPELRDKGPRREAFAKIDLMALKRDFAFILDEKTPAQELIKAIRSIDKDLISDVLIFDRFVLGDGKVSLAVEVTLQPRIKTLTDPEIMVLSEKLIAHIEKKLGGILRSS